MKPRKPPTEAEVNRLLREGRVQLQDGPVETCQLGDWGIAYIKLSTHCIRYDGRTVLVNLPAEPKA